MAQQHHRHLPTLTGDAPGHLVPSLHCRALIIVADDDHVTSWKSLAPQLRAAPDAGVAVIPGGHFDVYETNHQQALDATLPFLRRALALT